MAPPSHAGGDFLDLLRREPPGGIAALQSRFPGIAAAARGGEWRIAVPAALRIGHDAGFTAFMREFLAAVADPASRAAREQANLPAKYHVTTESVARSRG